MKILPHDFLRAIATHHQRLSPTNQTNKQRKRPHTVSLLLFKNLRSARKTIFFFFFFCFKLWVGFFCSAENSVLTYHAHTSWRQALPQYARPVARSWHILIQGSNTTTTIVADSLSYLLFYTACVCVFRPQEFGIRAITSSTTPHRHGTLLPTVVLPIFSSSIFGANNSHSACLPLPAALLLYSIELDRAPAPRT